MRLRFAPKPDKDARPLREGPIDLEIGVIGTAAPELRTRALFDDRLVGVVRRGHSLLDGGALTAERYAAGRHVLASPQGDFSGPVDDALATIGLARTVLAVVPGFPHAMRIARQSDLIAQVPFSSLGNAIVGDHAAAMGLCPFELPVETPDFTISALWHPRVDRDPAHRWLRGLVVSLCHEAYPTA